MKLVVGLGNPGTRYARTRHNIGFRACAAAAASLDATFAMQKKFAAALAKSKNGRVLFCQPQTMMNDSGRAVQLVRKHFRIPPQNILVLVDDKDLPFGRLRIRTAGTSGGHHGVQSMIDHLGTQNFSRLRIGIASHHPIADTAKFVLQRFSAREEKIIPEILASAQDVVNVFLAEEKLPHADIDIE